MQERINPDEAENSRQRVKLKAAVIMKHIMAAAFGYGVLSSNCFSIRSVSHRKRLVTI